MLFQALLRIIIVAAALTTAQSKVIEQKYCADCDEEVWEEVPCETITTTTPETVIITSTPLPPVTTIPTKISTEPTATSTYAPPPPINNPVYPVVQNSSAYQVEASDEYKNCYCECKSGCREFCRKVVLNPDTSKQVLHLSKIQQTQDYGQVEIKHLHERNYIKAPSAYQAEPAEQLPTTLTYVAESPPLQVEKQPAKSAYVAEKPLYKSEPTKAPLYSRPLPPLPPTEKYQEPPQEPQKLQQQPQRYEEENALGFTYEELAKLLSSGDDYVFPRSYPARRSTLTPYPPPAYYAQPSYGQVLISPINIQKSPSYAAPRYSAPIYSPPTYDPPNYDPPTYSPSAYNPPTYDPTNYVPPTYNAPAYDPSNYDPPTNDKPTYDKPTYNPPPYYPKPSYSPNSISAVDAQSAISGDAKPIAIASAPNIQVNSKFENYSKKEPYDEPLKYALSTSPPDVKDATYEDAPAKLNGLLYNPVFKYMQERIYVSPPRPQGYRYSPKY